MNTRHFCYGAAILTVLGVTTLSWSDDKSSQDNKLVIYCGRGQALVEPLIEDFRKQTGIEVLVKYGDTNQLASTLREEGEKSPADLFWAQDAASLGHLTHAGLFATLPDTITSRVAPQFRSKSGVWVATSGRARVLAYSPARVKKSDLPQSIFDLTDPKWKGRIGWAPTNASFKAFVAAMITQHGVDKTRQWLEGMKKNDAKVYPKNSPIISALAAGEIDLGLPNHYYLLREKAKDPNYPVEQTFFKAGDVGNLLMVSGIGRLKSAKHVRSAERFIAFLLTAESAQKFFAAADMEYTAVKGVAGPPNLGGQEKLDQYAPKIDMDQLDKLEEVQKLLLEVGLT